MCVYVCVCVCECVCLCLCVCGCGFDATNEIATTSATSLSRKSISFNLDLFRISLDDPNMCSDRFLELVTSRESWGGEVLG